MKVTVSTIERPSGLSTIHSLIKQIDWNNSSDRKWLTNHLHWAMNNNREVRLVKTQINGIKADFVIVDETNV